jgi:hypothetical protein
LKENFSRFNFALYKEKEMADFRRWFIALAVLALMAGLASAQVGLGGSTTAGSLACSAAAASIPQLRAEGFTELTGDIIISCTGGPAYPVSTATVPSQVPITDITVYMAPNSPITSRLFSSSTGVSEVALLIDEPGSGLASGIAGGAATGSYGPRAPQLLCTTNSGCPAFVGTDPATGFEVAVGSNTGSGAAAANVYQGYLGAVGANTVTFYGVPVLPPVTTGISRVFRITNIRFPAVGLSNQAPIQATISTSPSTALPLGAAGTGSSFPVGVVISPGLTTKVGSAAFFAQCNSQTTALSSTLTFTEGFPTSFKTRVVPLNNVQYGAEQTNTASPWFQNIPGGLYGGFAANSESGYINSLDVSSGSTVYTAGLADFGTRLKAVFTNIPAGITLYVSTINTKGVLATAGSATYLQSTALLVATGTGESTSDGTAFTPIASTVTATGGTGLPAVPLAPNSSGVATAVWEVTNSQPSAVESVTFEVYISYAAAPGSITTANPYGLPQITSILNAPLNNVSLSFAPEPSQGAFTAAAGPVAGTNIIPRFTILNPSSFQWINIGLCQTTLLYPFVTANPAATGLGQGFDTGLAVANTSMDPFGALGIPTTPGTSKSNPAGTLAEIGSCTLYPYGFTLSSAGAQSAAPAVLKGCDLISNPVQGQNCFPTVAPGTVQTVLASQVFPGFQGYVIAVCNFQYAHGYAAVTDLGLRGLFSSYLALELIPDPLTIACAGNVTSAGVFTSTCTSNSLTAPRGVGIEQLIH